MGSDEGCQSLTNIMELNGFCLLLWWVVTAMWVLYETPPDVPVPVRAAVGGGIVVFLIFVVSLDDMSVLYETPPKKLGL